MDSDGPSNAREFDFPLDVIERIASFIDDHSTLLSFTQLSRRAYLQTRGLAFHTVHIHHRNSTEFLELLGHPFSSIPSSVTQLSIRGNNVADFITGEIMPSRQTFEQRSWANTANCRDIIPSRQTLEQPSWLNTVIRRFALLTGVKQLSITDLIWKFVNQETRDALTTIFSEIVVLELDGVLFAGYEEMMALLCAFPNLRELHLLDVVWLNQDGNDSLDWSDSDEEEEEQNCGGPALDAGGTVLHEVQQWTLKFPSLDVLAASPTAIWEVLMRMDIDEDDQPAPPPSLPVKTLVSPLLFDSGFLPLNNALKILGPSLEHLVLNLRRMEGNLKSPPSLENLSLNTNLRTLFLVLPRCLAENSLDWLLTILTQISSQKVIAITFWFQQHLNATQLFSFFPWAELDELLTTHPKFKNLERLVLEAPGASSWDVVPSKLKGCYDRKIVFVKRLKESFYRTQTKDAGSLDLYTLPTYGLTRDWLNFE